MTTGRLQMNAGLVCTLLLVAHLSSFMAGAVFFEKRYQLCGINLTRALAGLCGNRGTYTRNVYYDYSALQKRETPLESFQWTSLSPQMKPDISISDEFLSSLTSHRQTRFKRFSMAHSMCQTIVRYQRESIVAQCCCQTCTRRFLELYCADDEERNFFYPKSEKGSFK